MNIAAIPKGKERGCFFWKHCSTKIRNKQAKNSIKFNKYKDLLSLLPFIPLHLSWFLQEFASLKQGQRAVKPVTRSKNQPGPSNQATDLSEDEEDGELDNEMQSEDEVV